MLHIPRLLQEKLLFRTLIFVSTHCPFQTVAILFNFAVAIANLLLISGVVFPFACILAPRYSKLLTLSISSLSIFITASSLHLSVLMIWVFLTFRNNPLCSLCFFTDFIRFSSPVVVVARSHLLSSLQVFLFFLCAHHCVYFYFIAPNRCLCRHHN